MLLIYNTYLLLNLTWVENIQECEDEYCKDLEQQVVCKQEQILKNVY